MQITTKLNINWIYNCTPFVFVVWLNLEWIFKLVSSMKWEFICLFLRNETFWCEVTSNICFQFKVEQIDFVITVVSVYLVHLNQIAFKPVRVSGCHITKISEHIIECNITWNKKKMTAVSPLIHKSDKVLISLNNLSLKSNVQVARMKEIITN